MSRLSARFEALKARQEKALVGYVTAGDPTPELTVDIVVALAEAGADAVEIGLPFSDPLADGPSIQAASQRALLQGMTVPKALEVVRQIRVRAPELPLIIMTYYNPIWHYGLEKYAHDAKAAGADAHIVTDLTPEEAEQWIANSRKEELDTVFLLAPTSTSDRISGVSQLSTGFIYCVSRTGVTGARQDIPADLQSVVGAIKSQTDQPVCVGFGVSQPEHVRRIAAFADGVVVGSSLVDLINRHKEDADLLDRVRTYVTGLKAATRA